MKQIKITKRCIALFTAICLVLTGIQISGLTSDVLASDVTPESLGYTRMTLSDDLGIADGKYTGNKVVASEYSAGLHNTYLDVDVAFGYKSDGTTDASAGFRYGSNSETSWGGLQIAITDNDVLRVSDATSNKTAFTLTTEEAGVATFTSTFNLKFATKMVTNANSTTDITISMWINDKLVKQDVVFGGIADIGNYAGILTWSDATITVATPQEKLPENVTPEELGYNQVTLSNDFGIADGTYTGNKVVASEYSAGLNNTYLDVDVAFGYKSDGTTDVSAGLRYGSNGATSWGGLQIAIIDNDVLRVSDATSNATAFTLTTEEAGVTTFTSKFNLKFATKMVTNKNSTTDITISMWINDKLVKQNVAFGGIADIGNYVGILTWSDATIAVVSPQVEMDLPEDTTPEDLDYIRRTLSLNFGVLDGTYSGQTNQIKENNDSLHKTYLDVDVAFGYMSDGSIDAEAGLRYANGAGWAGIKTRLAEGGNLWIGDATAAKQYITITPEEAGITSFTETFNYKLGTEIANVSETEKNVKITVWINDKCITQKIFKKLNNIGNNVGLLTWSDATITVSTPIITPEDLGYERMTLSGDFGVADNTYTGNTRVIGESGGSLTNTYLDVNVAFDYLTDGTVDPSAGLRYANGGDWSGIKVALAANDVLWIGDSVLEKQYFTLTTAQAGVSSFTEMFNLKLATKIDVASETERDVTISVWINDKLVVQGVRFTALTYIGYNAGVLTWSDATITVETPEVTPEELGYERKTLSGDFGLADGTYTGNTNEIKTATGSLNKTYLDVDVAFDYLTDGTVDASAGLRYANSEGWAGIKVALAADDVLWVGDSALGAQYITITTEEAGIGSFTNLFNLKLATKIEAVSETEKDVTVTVWINDALIKKAKFTALTYIGTNAGLLTWSDATITVATPDVTPEQLGYKKMTLADNFGVKDGAYTGLSRAMGEHTGSLDGTYLDVDVAFGYLSDGSVDPSAGLRYANGGDWTGIKVALAADDVLWIGDSVLEQQYFTLTTAQAGVDSFTETFNLKLAVDVTPVSEMERDVTVHVWINDKLIVQEYQFDALTYIGYNAGLITWSDATIAVGTPEVTPEDLGYRKMTLSDDFGVSYGTYSGESRAMGEHTGTLNNTYLDVDVSFGYQSNGAVDPSAGLRYANGGGWSGIKVGLGTDGVLWIGDATLEQQYFTITPKKAGVDSFTETFNLKLATKVKPVSPTERDVIVSVWINDVLIIKGHKFNALTYIGYNAGLITWSDATITVGTPDPTPDELGYTRMTLADNFAIPDNIYTGTTKAMGEHTGTLNNTYLDVDVSFGYQSDGAVDPSAGLRYANGGDWSGIKVALAEGGLLWIGDSVLEKQYFTITPKEAGVTAFTETFNLKLATKVRIASEMERDVTVSVWINDNLIVEEYEFSALTYIGYNAGLITWSDATITVGTPDVPPLKIKAYSSTEYATYRLGGKNIAPEQTGYVFAGWYSDARCTKVLKSATTAGHAYAKFVAKETLTAKAQVISGTKATWGNTNIRFLTSVDSLLYDTVGFDITVEGRTKKTVSIKTVYEQLTTVTGDGTKDTVTPSGKFSPVSKYFAAYTYRKVPQYAFDMEFIVTPYWITLDGTTVYGETSVKTVGMGYKLIFDIFGEGEDLAKDVMPIAGYYSPTESNGTLGNGTAQPNMVTDKYYQLIKDAGVNLFTHSTMDYEHYPTAVDKILQLGEKYNIGVFVSDSKISESVITGATLTNDQMAARIAEYSDSPAYAGVMVVDEPHWANIIGESARDMGYYTPVVKQLAALNQNAGANLLPYWVFYDHSGVTEEQHFKNYVDEYLKQCGAGAKYLSSGYYVFDEGRTVPEYFYNLSVFREKAIGSGIPFWAVVQAGSQWNNTFDRFDSTTPYYPNEFEFDWNINTSLAYGAQGITYFPLVQPLYFAWTTNETKDDYDRNSLIAADGSTTQWYDYAVNIKAHIKAIDEVLMNSTSAGVIACGTQAKSDNANSSCLLDATWEELKSVNGNALVGCFNYKGKHAFYVVNYSTTASQNITLTFDSSCNFTVTQAAKETTKSGSSATLSMKAGEGVLIVLE